MKFSFEFHYEIFVFILYFHEIISIVSCGNYFKLFGNQIHILYKTKKKFFQFYGLSKNLDKKTLLNKMENKELEEKSSPIDSAKQVTTTEKKTKPKDPGRIAAGKKLAEYNKKAREAKKAGRENKEIPKENKDEIPKENNQEGSFSLTQILSVASIVVSLAGLYYKRKELMSFVRPEKNDFREPPIREMNLERSERRERRVGRIKISEEDLERLREEKQKMEEYLEESKKDSKLKPMD